MRKSLAFASFATMICCAAPASADFVPWPWAKSLQSVQPGSDRATVVGQIISADAEILKSNPPQLRISARIEVGSSGFENLRIVPLFYPASEGQWPTDGHYDFVVYADAPTNVVTPATEKIDVPPAIFDLGAADAIAGIRLHSATNCFAKSFSGDAPPKSQKCDAGK